MGACRSVLSFITSISTDTSHSLSFCCCYFYLLQCTPLFPVAFEHLLSNHFLHHRLLSHVIPPIDPP
ncbi:hypothetical protein C4D60_Mb01t19190 [Musa balbisiana]|uniref:Uncharacterized protein n=1 Tax=Musa balbisiana TaxID=52838 RepID=A0A4S8JNF6_MUSBA|nr:hypothetical protein C4D60_Mb01t19190 [Musa balbisiana]